MTDNPGPARRSVGLRTWVFFAGVALLFLGADQGTKAWVRHHLAGSYQVFEYIHPRHCASLGESLRATAPVACTNLLANYADLRYEENPYGGWGLLRGVSTRVRRPFFLLASVLAIGFVVYLFRGLGREQRLSRWALPLVLGGALGNLVDRVRTGNVVDFIHLHWRDRLHYPVFNVADIALTVGLALLLFEWVFGQRRGRPAALPKTG